MSTLPKHERVDDLAPLPSPLALHHGGELHDAMVRFADHGNPDGPPLVVLGGVSARAAPQWWKGMVGPGKALDPDTYRLIGMDYLTERTVDPRDQAQAVVAVLDHLGIDQAVAVGASYGGMVALALGVVAPARFERIVMVAAAHRPYPLGTAWRTVQRRILDLGLDTGRDAEGVALARALAMTTFRSPEEFEARFAGPPKVVDGDIEPLVDSYLTYNGERYAERFSAAAYRALITSVDLHWIEPEQVAVPVYLYGYCRDALVPEVLVRELAERLPQCAEVQILDSVHGHDAFLTDADDLDPHLRRALGVP